MTDQCPKILCVENWPISFHSQCWSYKCQSPKSCYKLRVAFSTEKVVGISKLCLNSSSRIMLQFSCRCIIAYILRWLVVGEYESSKHTDDSSLSFSFTLNNAADKQNSRLYQNTLMLKLACIVVLFRLLQSPKRNITTASLMSTF